MDYTSSGIKNEYLLLYQQHAKEIIPSCFMQKIWQLYQSEKRRKTLFDLISVFSLLGKKSSQHAKHICYW